MTSQAVFRFPRVIAMDRSITVETQIGEIVTSQYTYHSRILRANCSCQIPKRQGDHAKPPNVDSYLRRKGHEFSMDRIEYSASEILLTPFKSISLPIATRCRRHRCERYNRYHRRPSYHHVCHAR